MKYFSLAIVATFLCATVVSAAPSSPNPTFEELAFDPLAEIYKKVTEHWVDLQCVRDVITRVIGESDIKEKWEQTKTEFNELVTVEWKNCQRMEDRTDENKCKLEVVRKGVDFITKFVKTVLTENKEMFQKLRDQMFHECFEEHALFKDTDTRAGSIADQFQCLADVLGDVSKANGMEGMWSKAQPEMQQRLDKWKECANAGNKIMVIMCNIREGLATYKIMGEYIQMMVAENPKAAQDIMRGIQERCGGQKTPDEFDDFLFDEEKENGSDENVDRLKCMIEAVDDAIKESDFQGIWDETKQNLTNVVENMETCKTEQTRTLRLRCMRKEMSRTREIIFMFFREWRQTNRDTFRRMRNYVRERCFL